MHALMFPIVDVLSSSRSGCMHAPPPENSLATRSAEMTERLKIAVFDGDGIGPEITQPTLAILDRLAALSGKYAFDFEQLPAGAAHYARTGESLPAASLKAASEADAILLSAMGDPAIRYPDGTEISPQIDLRKEFGLYLGLRPVTVSARRSTSKLTQADAGERVVHQAQSFAQRHADRIRKFERGSTGAAFGSVDGDEIGMKTGFQHGLADGENLVRLADAQLDARGLAARKFAQAGDKFEQFDRGIEFGVGGW